MTKEEMNVLKEVCFEYGVKVRARRKSRETLGCVEYDSI